MSKIFFAILLFIFFTKSVSAAEFSPEKFYDWSNWYRVGSVLAEATVSAEAKADVKKVQGLLPDSPFYFLKPLVENITLSFTFDFKSRELKRLDNTEERLAEAIKLLEKKQYNLASKNLDRYKSSLSKVTENVVKLKNSKVNADDLIKKLELIAAKHSLVLEELEEDSPQELKNNIETALKTSQKIMDKSADELGKSSVPTELKNRLESLRVLGVLSPEEVSSVLNITSREGVRARLAGLLNQGILSPTDAKKIDEAQINYFPSEFVRISESRKLQEFINLENQKPDEQTQKKISEFTKKYKPGDIIPPDIKKWWIWTQRYKELQATLRPELVEPKKAQTDQKTLSPPPQTPTSTSTSPTLSLPPEFGSQCNFGPHAIGTIFGEGKCYYLRCEEGWYNNDLDVNNGCESNIDAGVTPLPGSIAAGVCGSGQVKNENGKCVPENQTCTDTNSAVPFYTGGSCTDSSGTYTNYCDGSVSKDYFCEGTWDPQTFSSKNHRCVVNSFDCGIANTAEPYTCSSGACVKASGP